MKKISAVIACYKDEQAIPQMYKRLKDTFNKIGVDYEIIFVNDGSPDNTEDVLRKLTKQDSAVIAVNHARNFSSQMAFTSGMDIATGDVVVLLDGDLQDPPEAIEDFYKKWSQGYDVVYGVRSKREGVWLIHPFYKLFYRLFHNISYIDIPVNAGDFSLISRRVVEALRVFPEKDRFLRGLRAWVGFRQTGVEYTRQKRMFGKTTNNFLSNLGWASKGIFSFSYFPLHIISVFALFMFFLALAGIVFQIIMKIFQPGIPHGISTIIVLILFIGSLQLLGISIIGQYIGRMFEEVKNRPKYIVKSVIRNGITDEPLKP
ncbi:glycosyltransferase family 2 protein [Candidatus Omnitrophota bacterium]